MNTQQAFDIMVAHLRQQKRPSRSDSSGCLYRGPDGLKCAVGALIPDELYSERMENQNLYNLMREKGKFPGLSELFADVDIQVLSDFQDTHDFNEPARWEQRFKLCAEEFGLNYTAPQGV